MFQGLHLWRQWTRRMYHPLIPRHPLVGWQHVLSLIFPLLWYAERFFVDWLCGFCCWHVLGGNGTKQQNSPVLQKIGKYGHESSDSPWPSARFCYNPTSSLEFRYGSSFFLSKLYSIDFLFELDKDKSILIKTKEFSEGLGKSVISFKSLSIYFNFISLPLEKVD